MVNKLEDRKTLLWFAEIITELDKLVFPEKPIEHVRLIGAAPGEGDSYFSYGMSEYFGEYYMVFEEGISKAIEEETLTKRYVLSVGGTEEGTILGIAAHEARHRLQYISLIEFFSPEDVRKIPFLKFLADYFICRFGNDKKEFDAKVVEYLVTGRWHPGLSLHDIVPLIRAGPESLAKIEEALGK